MSQSEVQVQVGDEVRVYIPHEERDAWCRVNRIDGRWLDVTPVDPCDANVSAFTLGQVLEVRHGR